MRHPWCSARFITPPRHTTAPAAWPTLPEAIKAGIMAMVRASFRANDPIRILTKPTEPLPTTKRESIVTKCIHCYCWPIRSRFRKPMITLAWNPHPTQLPTWVFG
jgi:hypothetical protein